MKRDVRDCKYIALNEKRSKVGLGVAGSAAYGNDSPLYGAGGLRPQIRPRLGPYAESKTANRHQLNRDARCNIDVRLVCLRQKTTRRIEGCGVGDAALAFFLCLPQIRTRLQPDATRIVLVALRNSNVEEGVA